MSAHGERAEQHGHAGREYWSRRPWSSLGWGRIYKRWCHRKERALRRRETRECGRFVDGETAEAGWPVATPHAVSVSRANSETLGFSGN